MANSVIVNVSYVVYLLIKGIVCVWQDRKFVYQYRRDKSSDTLVILGAGDSINHVSNEQWEKLSSFDMAGLSYSALLPYKQKFYFYETPADKGVIDEHRTRLLPFIVKRRTEGVFERLIWKNPVDKRACLDSLLQGFGKVITPHILAQNESVLRFVLRIIRFLKLEKIFMFQSRGSIFTLALFGESLGYKNIIFCGVDLNGSPYFFENNDEYDEVGLINPIQLDRSVVNKKIHPTNDPSRGLPIEKSLKVLSESSQSKFYVVNKKTNLFRYFPEWNCGLGPA